jgi:hypothetical protein
MCATALSFQECEDIQRPLINAILPKMGISRKAARAVVLGMAQFGGPGLDHLATLQGHSRLQYLLGHIRCGDHTGQLMRMPIEYTQPECDTMDNILEQDYDRFSNCIINKKWITEIWQHLYSFKATVAVQQKWKPCLGQINDIAIMDCLTASNQLSRGGLQDINRCRIYIWVFFLSYIMNIQGRSIKTWAISGRRQTARTSAWAWQVQQRPTIWKAWKDALELLAPERTVTPALGAWIKEHHHTQEWYYDTDDKTIYQNGQWEKLQAQNIGRLRFCTVGTPCDITSKTTHIIDIKHRARYKKIVHQDEVKQYVESQSTLLNTYTSGIGNCIHALPKHVQRLVGNIPTLAMPMGWDTTEPTHLIVATDG